MLLLEYLYCKTGQIQVVVVSIKKTQFLFKKSLTFDKISLDYILQFV